MFKKTQNTQKNVKANPNTNKVGLVEKNMQNTQKIKPKSTVISKNCSCVCTYHCT